MKIVSYPITRPSPNQTSNRPPHNAHNGASSASPGTSRVCNARACVYLWSLKSTLARLLDHTLETRGTQSPSTKP